MLESAAAAQGVKKEVLTMGDHKLEETKGRIKEAAGDLTDDEELKCEGAAALVRSQLLTNLLGL